MSRFTLSFPAGNGGSQTTSKASDFEKCIAALAHGVLSGLLPAMNPASNVKIELKIESHEHHEHKYFILHPESVKKPEYTALPSLLGLTVEPSEYPDEDMRTWRREVEAFDRMKDRLWNDRKLRNKFVAIRNGQVVDHDTNKFELAKRVRRQFPDEVVLIERVQRGERIVEMPSPELE